MIPLDKDNNMPMNHHFKAIASCAFVIYNLCKLLEDSEIEEELSKTILIQCEIINCMVEGKHFGHKALDQIIENCVELVKEIKSKTEATP